MSEVSKLQIYSIGIVAANKPLSSKTIEVTPIEDLPMVDGELTDNTADTNSKAKDTEGAAYETQVAASLTVTATWLPFSGGNRMTAPDVRRGERVILYRFADQDKFYWVTLGQDMRLRKLETVIWGISATADEEVPPDADSMYWMEWSSHNKMIHIHTSTADGEPFAYDLQLNTADGTFIFQDDDGQVFSLDSKERIWRVENRDGSYVEVNKREITEFAPDKITLKARDIEFAAGNNITAGAGNNITTGAGNNISASAGSTIEETAGAQITSQAPATHITSAVLLTGSEKITGSMNVAGPIRGSTGGADGGGIDLSTHTHREQGDGELVSQPISGGGL